MNNNIDDKMFFIDKPFTNKITVSEYRRRVRISLLIELAKVFDESLSVDWKNWEVSDFLNSYMSHQISEEK